MFAQRKTKLSVLTRLKIVRYEGGEDPNTGDKGSRSNPQYKPTKQSKKQNRTGTKLVQVRKKLNGPAKREQKISNLWYLETKADETQVETIRGEGTMQVKLNKT